MQIGSVAGEREQDFQPHEERCEHDGLEQVVEQGGRVSLGKTVSGDLADPSNDLADQDNGSDGGGVMILNKTINKPFLRVNMHSATRA